MSSTCSAIPSRALVQLLHPTRGKQRRLDGPLANIISLGPLQFTRDDDEPGVSPRGSTITQYYSIAGPPSANVDGTYHAVSQLQLQALAQLGPVLNSLVLGPRTVKHTKLTASRRKTGRNSDQVPTTRLARGK